MLCRCHPHFAVPRDHQWVGSVDCEGLTWRDHRTWRQRWPEGGGSRLGSQVSDPIFHDFSVATETDEGESSRRHGLDVRFLLRFDAEVFHRRGSELGRSDLARVRSGRVSGRERRNLWAFESEGPPGGKTIWMGFAGRHWYV